MAEHGFFLTWRVHKIPRYLLIFRAAIYCSISLQLPAWRKKGCLLVPSCSNGEEDQLHYTCSCPFLLLLLLLFPLKDFPVSGNPSTSNLPPLILIFLWETHMYYTVSWSIRQLFLWTPWIAFAAWQERWWESQPRQALQEFSEIQD